MANLDDVLTTVKNISTALSTVASTWLKGQGNQTSVTVTEDTLIVVGKGRLVNFSVTSLGSAAGMIHNANSVANATASNALCIIPDDAIGITQVGQVFNMGLVVIVGTDQKINVTFYT